MTDKPAIFHASVETQTLIKALAPLKPGDSISYASLNAAINGDVQRQHHYALATAQKSLLRDTGAVFAPVRGEGIRRLLDAEISDKTEAVIASVRGKAARHGKELAAANFAELNSEQQAKHGRAMLQTALIATSVSRPTRQRIAELDAPKTVLMDRETILRIYGGTNA